MLYNASEKLFYFVQETERKMCESCECHVACGRADVS